MVKSDPEVKSKGTAHSAFKVTLLLNPKGFASGTNRFNVALLYIIHTEYLCLLYDSHEERQLSSYSSYPYVSSHCSTLCPLRRTASILFSV